MTFLIILLPVVALACVLVVVAAVRCGAVREAEQAQALIAAARREEAKAVTVLRLVPRVPAQACGFCGATLPSGERWCPRCCNKTGEVA